MDIKDSNLYLDFLSYALNGGPGHGAEVTCELDITKGVIYYWQISSPGLGYTANNTITLLGGTGPASTFTINSVDGNGRVLSISRAAVGYGYTSSNDVATSGGTGTGLTLNITVSYVVKQANIIEPGMYYHEVSTPYYDNAGPYPPFGTPRISFIPPDDNFNNEEPSHVVMVNEHTGIGYVGVWGGTYFGPSPPTIVVESWKVKSVAELGSALKDFDNLYRWHRWHDALSTFAQCNVSNPIVDELLVNLTQIINENNMDIS